MIVFCWLDYGHVDKRGIICDGRVMARATIRLRGEDAALVMRGDGEMELMIPDGEGGSRVPDHVVMLMAIAERLSSDPDFCEDLIEHMQDTVSEPLGINKVLQH